MLHGRASVMATVKCPGLYAGKALRSLTCRLLLPKDLPVYSYFERKVAGIGLAPWCMARREVGNAPEGEVYPGA